MTPLQQACYAFLSGLTLCGLLGTAMEIVAGHRLLFAEPFVSRRRVLLSLAAAAAAGPFMLGNEALAAWRAGSISAVLLVACVLMSAVWSLATGVVVLDLAVRLCALL